MKQQKIRIVFSIVFLFLFCATIGLIISMSQIDQQTEKTTTACRATISHIEINDTGKEMFVEIHTEEYRSSLLISTNVSKNIKMKEIGELKKGQTISFRMENKNAEQIDKVEFLGIVSLETDKKCIFSLEDYNKYIQESAYPARMASVAMSVIFLFLSLFFWFKFKDKRPKTRKD